MSRLTAYEEEERELLTRIRYVKCDSLDCFELIIAKERISMFRQFAADVVHILKLGDSDFYNKEKK